MRIQDRDLREDAGAAAFAKFAGAVTERYREYDILWEIINEPNENNDMSVVSNYVRVCEVLYPVIKAANPSAKVSVGSIAMQSDAWLEQAIKERCSPSPRLASIMPAKCLAAAGRCPSTPCCNSRRSSRSWSVSSGRTVQLMSLPSS